MAIFHFRCSECGKTMKRLGNSLESLIIKPCSCGGVFEHDHNQGSATFSVKERIDNGMMPKAVVRDTDTVQLAQERSDRTKNQEEEDS